MFIPLYNIARYTGHIVVTVGLFCVLMLCGLAVTYASTKAGTVINNQASASYLDTLGVRRIATSNVVETLIRQVAAFELSLDQRKPGSAGQEVFFTHTLINTGNGVDSFNLDVGNGGADDLDLSNLQIYKDTDRDGVPDSYTPIVISDLLEPGESQNFIVSGVVPAASVEGDTGIAVIKAQSVFDSSVTQANNDTVVVTNSAVVEISKSISAHEGFSPDGPFTVSIHYRNRSSVPADNVVLIDALPTGMNYIHGSGRWSEGGGIDLTDTADSQPGVRYCAYDPSCTGLPEAETDTDNLSTNQVTAIIETVAAGQEGYITFDVSVASGLAAGVLFNTAELQYQAGGALIDRIVSNTVPFVITAGAMVVINGSNTSSADGVDEPREIFESVFGANSNLPECQLDNSDPDGDGYGLENGAQCVVPDLQAGNTVFFKNTVWNRGNTTDTFDITTVGSSFPEGTLIRLLQSDGQTQLPDSSGNAIADTGPIVPGGSYEIVLQVVLPSGVSGDNAGVPFSVTSVATSVSDPLVSNQMLNLLHNITAAMVDVTNNAELGDPLSAGIGGGPEQDAVTSVNAIPGDTVTFDLYINNTSAFPLEYNLDASIHSDFASVELPTQWQVRYALTDNTAVTGTVVIAPGEFVQVIARVTIRAEAVPAADSLYFRASNERYSIEDIKHDEVVVTLQQSLLLGIDQEGQTQAGSSYVYNHTLANTGNAEVTNISLSTTDSRASEGWSSTIYEDSDGDGTLSTSDQVISVTDLQVGETKTLFVKVYAPGTAADGVINLTEFSAAWGSDVLIVTDVTQVSSAEISVIKEQALDNGCDGVLDSAYSSSVFSVEPGDNCISYRLTAINAGSENVMNVVVADATPTFTSYVGSATCDQTNCSVAEPLPGAEGEVVASLPLLLAGDTIVVEFRVRVD